MIIPPHCWEEAQNAASHPESTAGQDLSTTAQLEDGIVQAEESAASADEVKSRTSLIVSDIEQVLQPTSTHSAGSQ